MCGTAQEKKSISTGKKTVHREGRNKNTESKHESELSVTTVQNKGETAL